jgi:hypothetical protein
MATELIKVRGITYRTGSVLLLERTGEPVLVKIQRIYVYKVYIVKHHMHFSIVEVTNLWPFVT